MRAEINLNNDYGCVIADGALQGVQRDVPVLAPGMPAGAMPIGKATMFQDGGKIIVHTKLFDEIWSEAVDSEQFDMSYQVEGEEVDDDGVIHVTKLKVMAVSPDIRAEPEQPKP